MSISLSQYVLYLQYLAVGIVMVVVFAAVYLRCTPAAELRLIKEGNLACALSFGGALVGFCLPLATSIANNIHLLDFMLWGGRRRSDSNHRVFCRYPPGAGCFGRVGRQ